MGNHVARIGNDHTGKKHHQNQQNSSSSIVAADHENNKNNLKISPSPSGSDIEHNTPINFRPVDKLAKILVDRAHHEEDINSISENIFVKYLFPNHHELGSRLYRYFHTSAKVTTKHLSTSIFKQQVEKFLSVMNDHLVLEIYVKMYTTSKDEPDLTPKTLEKLLMISYQLATTRESSSCLDVHRIIDAVVTSCFHGKDNHSVSFVSNWLWQHCPRVVFGVHRYVVHVLTTAYRNGQVLLSTEELQPQIDPVTPVLEKAISFDQPENLLPLSHVWLLSTSLPLSYIQTEESPNQEPSNVLTMKMSGSPCPSHWTLLYNSNEHGSGANRFLHHILGYRGPSILFIKADSGANEFVTYCICNAIEWRESHLYWGSEESVILELKPQYRIIEKGSKLLYLNTSIRGYPQGLRAGKDTRNPYINIDQAFQSVSFGGSPHRLSSLEAWGCGDKKSRETQLDIKKWQVKEAEKQRVVKLSAAEWLDHPDRYLLQLAGRPTYNDSNT